MATSIGSAAAFTYTNMKPASGEQIDALWGQNISDNTAFLRSQKQQYTFTSRGWDNDVMRAATSGGAAVGTFLYLSAMPSSYVYRQARHNLYVATVRFDGTYTFSGATPDLYATHGVAFFGDLGTYWGTTGTSDNNRSADYTIGTTLSVQLNLDSYLSVGSWGTFIGYFSGTVTDGGNPNPNAIKGTFQEPKLYTTWAN